MEHRNAIPTSPRSPKSVTVCAKSDLIGANFRESMVSKIISFKCNSVLDIFTITILGLEGYLGTSSDSAAQKLQNLQNMNPESKFIEISNPFMSRAPNF